MSKGWSQSGFFDVVLLTCAAAMVVGYRISEPSVPYFDEVFFVPSAQAILSGEGRWEVTHPPLGKLLMALSIGIFGDTPFAWRCPSCVAGSLLPSLVYKLLRGGGASRCAAFVAGALISLDGLCVTQARIGLVNAPSLAFGMAALVSAFGGRFVLSALFVTAAIATKLSGLVFLPLVALIFAVRSQGASSGRPTAGLVCMTVVGCALVYLGSFAVLLRNRLGTFFESVVAHHKVMVGHHLNAVEPHRWESEWWTWPLSLQPIWYGFERIPGGDLVRGVICLANPLSSALVVVGGLSFLFLLLTRAPRASLVSVVAILGFLLSWLPWAVSPRTTMYHYYYPALVFGIALFATCLDLLGERAKRLVSLGCVTGSLLFFVYWYPLWTALPISAERYEAMMWRESWQKGAL